ncbi:hypothetical protein AGMMS49992_25950 [Clostridia bacterium]|nr:hypothetical protein AGMMS49992_25950 [Clostridia bacterium]
MDIRCIRRTKGITQVELARKVGITQSGYSQIENGEVKPKVKVAKRIAQVLGTNWAEFYDEATEQNGGDNQCLR